MSSVSSINSDGTVELAAQCAKLSVDRQDPLKMEQNLAYKHTCYVIVEIAGKLFVLEKDECSDSLESKYMLSKVSLVDIYIQSLEGPSLVASKVARKWWEHATMREQKGALLEKLFAPNGMDQIPPVFKISHEFAEKAFSESIRERNPSTTVHPESKEHFFLHLARSCRWNTLNSFFAFLQKFSEDFQTVKEETLLAFLLNPNIEPRWLEKIEKQIFSLLDDCTSERLQHFTLVAKRYPLSEEVIAKLSPEEKEWLYTIAYNYRNPFIHEPSTANIQPQDFSINLLWIPKDTSAQEFLIGDPEQFRLFLGQVKDWASLNLGTPVHIWYDSLRTEESCIKRTSKAVTDVLSGKGCVVFCDVQNLLNTKGIRVDKWPLYFQVDILRAWILDSELSKRSIAVYADLDVKPLSSSQLFDPRTMTFLSKYGCVFSGLTTASLENSFQIFSNHQPDMIRLHREMILEASICQANEGLVDAQHVYRIYPIMITKFSKAAFGDEQVEYPVKPVAHPPSRFGSAIHLPKDV